MEITSFFNNIISLYGENLLWYAGFAIPFFIIFWVIGKKYFNKIRIQETKRATLHHIKHDLGFSASTFLIFAIMDVCFL
jgi:ring-1,2-phenylacetyl-CoA epoxidase subunit PaaE